MANSRQGAYGYYYGSFFGESEYLTLSEMQTNAIYIYKCLSSLGWSLNAISGLLGNMQAESTINPGCWQSHNVGNYSGGYGLVQWTPATKYINWCSEYPGLLLAPEDMDSNLLRIAYEVENNIQWIATENYDYSFFTFCSSLDTPYNLACAFAWNYERSYTVLYGTYDEQEALRQKRGGYANYWYEYLGGQDPPDPDEPDDPVIPSTLKRKKYNFLLFTANKRRQSWTKRNF